MPEQSRRLKQQTTLSTKHSTQFLKPKKQAQILLASLTSLTLQQHFYQKQKTLTKLAIPLPLKKMLIYCFHVQNKFCLMPIPLGKLTQLYQTFKPVL
jgi:hypothetical protein